MDLTIGLKESVYKKVRINLISAYKWGRGWTPSEAETFKNEVFPALERAGFVIKEGTSYGGCETLTDKEKFSSTYLYLHPMEFTGYMKDEDIEKVLDVVRNCSCIERVEAPQIEIAYGVTDQEYASILAEHSKEILEMAREAKEKKKLYDFEFDFMRMHRIPRVGDSSCLSSSDFEYKWLNSFIKVMESLELL